MRKYENVDVVAALGAVVELNTENYKSDFKYDVERFKQAAKNPNGNNNRLLRLSRQSGTWCFPERDAYIKGTEAFHTWNGYADILGSQSSYPTVIVTDRILAYVVEIKGIESGRIKGDLYELDYRDHIRQLNRAALPLHTVTAKYEDGTKITLPHEEFHGKRERLYHSHGKVLSLKSYPEDKSALHDVLQQAREKREKEARPAAFKLRVQNPKQPTKKQPTIKQQIAAGKKQLEQQRAAAPQRAAAKNKNMELGD